MWAAPARLGIGVARVGTTSHVIGESHSLRTGELDSNHETPTRFFAFFIDAASKTPHGAPHTTRWPPAFPCKVGIRKTSSLTQSLFAGGSPSLLRSDSLCISLLQGMLLLPRLWLKSASHSNRIPWLEEGTRSFTMCRVPLLMMAAAIHACNGGRIAENRVPGVSMLAGFIVPARFRAGVPSGLWGRRPTRCRLARLRACSNVEEGEEERFGDGDYYSAPSSPPAFSHMGRKTIGVDYGLRRTGCCVSVGYAPRPLPLILHKDEVPAFSLPNTSSRLLASMGRCAA